MKSALALFVLLALSSGSAAAQTAGPAPQPDAGAQAAPATEPVAPAEPAFEPAVQTTFAPLDEAAADGGSLIIGDEDSPIGLYIMPWRNPAAEEGLGRPARLLQEAMLPIDRDSFKRQVDYYETLAAHRAQQQAVATRP